MYATLLINIQNIITLKTQFIKFAKIKHYKRKFVNTYFLTYVYLKFKHALLGTSPHLSELFV